MCIEVDGIATTGSQESQGEMEPSRNWPEAGTIGYSGQQQQRRNPIRDVWQKHLPVLTIFMLAYTGSLQVYIYQMIEDALSSTVRDGEVIRSRLSTDGDVSVRVSGTIADRSWSVLLVFIVWSLKD
jgi:hypothetical protein